MWNNCPVCQNISNTGFSQLTGEKTSKKAPFSSSHCRRGGSISRSAFLELVVPEENGKLLETSGLGTDSANSCTTLVSKVELRGTKCWYPAGEVTIVPVCRALVVTDGVSDPERGEFSFDLVGMAPPRSSVGL